MLLGSALCFAQSEQPSLAELARQSKSPHKAVKTFTEADLPGAGANAGESATAVPAARSENPDTSSATVAQAEKKDNIKADAPATRDSAGVAELKKQIESFQQERDTWKNSVKRYETLLSNETSDFRRQMYQDAIENDKKNVAFYQQKLYQAQAELVNVQKPASSGPAGAAGAPSQP